MPAPRRASFQLRRYVASPPMSRTSTTGRAIEAPYQRSGFSGLQAFDVWSPKQAMNAPRNVANTDIGATTTATTPVNIPIPARLPVPAMPECWHRVASVGEHEQRGALRARSWDRADDDLGVAPVDRNPQQGPLRGSSNAATTTSRCSGSAQPQVLTTLSPSGV